MNFAGKDVKKVNLELVQQAKIRGGEMALGWGTMTEIKTNSALFKPQFSRNPCLHIYHKPVNFDRFLFSDLMTDVNKYLCFTFEIN